MQIRVQAYKGRDGQIKQGKSVSLLRYAYDSEKRRSKQVIIGTVDRWATALPPDIEAILDREKKEWFYDRSRSYMIRELVMAGLRALKEESEVADGNHEGNT